MIFNFRLYLTFKNYHKTETQPPHFGAAVNIEHIGIFDIRIQNGIIISADPLSAIYFLSFLSSRTIITAIRARRAAPTRTITIITTVVTVLFPASGRGVCVAEGSFVD